jgi:hypothetical protein
MLLNQWNAHLLFLYLVQYKEVKSQISFSALKNFLPFRWSFDELLKDLLTLCAGSASVSPSGQKTYSADTSLRENPTVIGK